MHIGLFLGSFNPIHNGHIGLAQYILSHSGLDEIWLVVSPNNPLKNKSTLLDENIRMDMVRLSVAGLEHIEPCDIELTLPRPSYTANTLRALTAKYPEHEFSLIIGSDNMAIFRRWREWEYIYDNFNIFAYPRMGDNIEMLSRQYPKMKVIKDAPLFIISSTEIRKLYKEGKDFSEFVPQNVYLTLSENKNFWE